MILEHLDIVNFKNIAGAQLDFAPRINCLLGRNGMGKSNLLECIHLLSFARPFAPVREHSLIRHGEEQMLAKGRYAMDAGQTHDISCAIVKGRGKSLKLDGKEYERLSAHIGRFPVVTVAPADAALVGDGAETRRRLMDIVISQAHPDYLPRLIRYNKALEGRNHMLRAGLADPLLFESVESIMTETAADLHAMRSHWVREISPVFRDYYSRIACCDEHAAIAYRSALNEEDMASLLASTRGRDAAIGYTTAGIHRDDLTMQLDGRAIRYLGSQGQMKTYTIALRLAIFHYLHQTSGTQPILLLDDIFDKLDADRTEHILRVVAEGPAFGQIFVTDTNRKHLDEILAAIPGEHLTLNVEEGRFSPA